MFSVTIQLDQNSDAPLHRQIADGIERAIGQGAFKVDRNLPSVRALASRLNVSPATVAAAYRDLVARRVVEAHSRSGYRAAAGGGITERTIGLATRTDGAPYPLHRIEPALHRHPAAEVGRFIAESAISAAAGGYEDYRGFPPLREALAVRFREAGIDADPGSGMLITNGAQHAIALAARIAGPGSRIAMEDPAYPGARLAFQESGAEILPIDSGENGPDIVQLEAAAKSGRIDLFYCCPTYGNPTGRSWSAESRERVLRTAAKHGITILEDDYLGDLDYLDERPPRLAAGAPKVGARVVYVRTYSKCLLPALRIAGVSAPSDLIDRLLAAKAVDDICGSAFLQRGLALYLEESRYEQHLERMKPHYRAIREALRRRASAAAAGLRFGNPAGGLCLIGELPEGIDSERYADACRAEGVLISPGPAFWAAPARGAGKFRIGFGCLEEEDVAPAIEGMERALGKMKTRETESFFRRALL